MSQEQARRTESADQEDGQQAPAVVEDKQELADELDDLLDEIDDVLEENAEEFVRSYIQRGGQ